MKENLKVTCRIRPSIQTSQERSSKYCIFSDQEVLITSEKPLSQVKGQNMLREIQSSVNNLKPYQQIFHFDQIFDQEASQVDVFKYLQPFIQNFCQGTSTCIVLYGPSESGKSHTLRGGDGNETGILIRAADRILNYISSKKQYYASVSAYQVYCDEITDLISNRISKTPTYKQIRNIQDLHSTIKQTLKNRKRAIRNKSHMIIQITIFKENSCFSEINFVDLAGSDQNSKRYLNVSQTESDFIVNSNKSLIDALQNQLIEERNFVNWNQNVLT